MKLTIYNLQLTTRPRGYTLVELMVAVGLFAIIMLLASGAYIVMIGINRQSQSIATGIDTLSFALETMTRTIRTGTGYTSSVNSFSLTDSDGNSVSYSLSPEGAITQSKLNQNNVALTDPSVTVSSLVFYVRGTASGDAEQARVTIVVSGTVVSGPGKTEAFTVETGATMRGADL